MSSEPTYRISPEGFDEEPDIVAASDEETDALRDLLRCARNYLESFRWCSEVEGVWLAYGAWDILAVCYARLVGVHRGVDRELWVLVGDLPSAYFVVDDATDAATVLEIYCEHAEDWAKAILERGPMDGIFPFEAPEDEEHAKMLLSRTEFIRGRILPLLPTDKC